jgi:hypothetical protein
VRFRPESAVFAAPTAVIAGLDPAIHEEFPQTLIVRIAMPLHLMDCRVKPGKDDGESEYARYGSLLSRQRAFKRIA